MAAFLPPRSAPREPGRAARSPTRVPTCFAHLPPSREPPAGGSEGICTAWVAALLSPAPTPCKSTSPARRLPRETSALPTRGALPCAQHPGAPLGTDGVSSGSCPLGTGGDRSLPPHTRGVCVVDVFLGLKILKLISGHSASQNARPLQRGETPFRRNPGRSRASIPCSLRSFPGTETPGTARPGRVETCGEPGGGRAATPDGPSPPRPVPPAFRAPSRAPGPAAFRRKADE